MKTAISVPDETFEAASRRANELGISRSEFFSTAAARYVAELDAASLTARIDAALERDADDDTEAIVVGAGRRALLVDGEDW